MGTRRAQDRLCLKGGSEGKPTSQALPGPQPHFLPEATKPHLLGWALEISRIWVWHRQGHLRDSWESGTSSLRRARPDSQPPAEGAWSPGLRVLSPSTEIPPGPQGASGSPPGRRREAAGPRDGQVRGLSPPALGRGTSHSSDPKFPQIRLLDGLRGKEAATTPRGWIPIERLGREE